MVGCGCTVNFIVCSCRLIACVQGKDKARALFCTGYCTSCGSVSAAEEAALNKRSVAGAAATASVIRPSVTINTFTVEAAGSALSFIDDTFLTGLSSLSSAGKSAQTTSFGHFWRLSLKIATQNAWLDFPSCRLDSMKYWTVSMTTLRQHSRRLLRA